MVIATCQHAWKKNGVDKYGNRRLRCKVCGKSILEKKPSPLGDLRTDLDKAAQVIDMLCEGLSIRSVGRLTGVDKNTIVRILVHAGNAIAKFSERTIRHMRVEEVEVDEIWGFCYCKKVTQHSQDKGYKFGDLYTYTAIDRNTKLYLTYSFGKRYTEAGAYFMHKLKACTTGRFQLSTDGWSAFEGLVNLHWGEGLDYGQITKSIIASRPQNAATRYSPGKIRKITKRVCFGFPDYDRISTSIAERGNLSIRMGVRRMTRLTNAFSKKWENHEAAMALWFGVYNFCKVHGTIKTTPAVAAGLTDHRWTIRELLERAAAA